LNVLIAADILKKDGKVVYCDQNLANIGTFFLCNVFKLDRSTKEKEIEGRKG